MIVRMHHLMRHGILQMAPIPELVCAQQDAVIRVEATTLGRGAAPAAHVLSIEIVAQQVEVVAHEAHDGRVLQQPGLLRLAAGAVGRLVQVVFDVEVGVALFWAGGAAEDAEEGRPGVEVFVQGGRLVAGGFGQAVDVGLCHVF